MRKSWHHALQNHYWHLRSIRRFDTAARRRYYRLIADEKKRLQQVGVDQEEIRLFCRMLSNLQNKNAETRYRAYAAQLKLDL